MDLVIGCNLSILTDCGEVWKGKLIECSPEEDKLTLVDVVGKGQWYADKAIQTICHKRSFLRNSIKDVVVHPQPPSFSKRSYIGEEGCVRPKVVRSPVTTQADEPVLGASIWEPWTPERGSFTPISSATSSPLTILPPSIADVWKKFPDFPQTADSLEFEVRDYSSSSSADTSSADESKEQSRPWTPWNAKALPVSPCSSPSNFNSISSLNLQDESKGMSHSYSSSEHTGTGTGTGTGTQQKQRSVLRPPPGLGLDLGVKLPSISILAPSPTHAPVPVVPCSISNDVADLLSPHSEKLHVMHIIDRNVEEITSGLGVLAPGYGFDFNRTTPGFAVGAFSTEQETLLGPIESDDVVINDGGCTIRRVNTPCFSSLEENFPAMDDRDHEFSDSRETTSSPASFISVISDSQDYSRSNSFESIDSGKMKGGSQKSRAVERERHRGSVSSSTSGSGHSTAHRERDHRDHRERDTGAWPKAPSLPRRQRAGGPSRERRKMKRLHLQPGYVPVPEVTASSSMSLF